MTKTYVLIGATSGIGQQVASRLVEHESIVYAISRRGKEAENQPGIHYEHCDVLAEEPTFPNVEGPIDGFAYFPGTITLRAMHPLF